MNIIINIVFFIENVIFFINLLKNILNNISYLCKISINNILHSSFLIRKKTGESKEIKRNL